MRALDTIFCHHIGSPLCGNLAATCLKFIQSFGNHHEISRPRLYSSLMACGTPSQSFAQISPISEKKSITILGPMSKVVSQPCKRYFKYSEVCCELLISPVLGFCCFATSTFSLRGYSHEGGRPSQPPLTCSLLLSHGGHISD